jgi:methylaspartate mutase sigma subunit
LLTKYKKLDDVVMMIGGNLVVGRGDPDEIQRKYKSYGFDLVCHQIDLNTGLDMLETHLDERTKERNT